MAVTIQPKRLFEGQIKGAVDTPDEAITAEVLKRAIPQLLIDELISRDDGQKDYARDKGIVTTTLGIGAHTQADNYSLFTLCIPDFAPGYNYAGTAGVVFKYDVATKKPLELRIADKAGRATFEGKFEDGRLVEAHGVSKSVKFEDQPYGQHTVDVSTKDGTTKVVADFYEAVETKEAEKKDA